MSNKQSNIELAFEAKKKQGHKAFIPFITAGDPDIDATEQFIYSLERAGSSVIEVGIPFSDPIADGPVIQEASLRALAQHTNLEKVFEMVTRVRENTQIPLVFLMYANTVYHYGTQAFFEKCGKVKVDGVIIPDVSVEEREEFDKWARENGVDLISLVAPTSKERTMAICDGAAGFIYCVSSLGVTGMRKQLPSDLEEMFARIEECSDLPTAIGFGISNKEQAQSLKEYADGIIIGSAIVEIIAKHGKESCKFIEDFSRDIISIL